MFNFRPTCPDCSAAVGEEHRPGCDVARCPICGHQRLSCGCETRKKSPRWDGFWPGVPECAAMGWYARIVPGQGWVPCLPTDEGASEDLNRLSRDGVWEPKIQRWIPRCKSV